MSNVSDRLTYYSEGQKILLEITQRIAAGGSLSAMLPDITHAAFRGFQADGIRVVLGGITPLAYATGVAAGKMIPFDTLLSKLVAQHGLIEIPDLNASLKSEYSPLSALKNILGALIALPLIAQHTQHGVLWIGYESPHQFEEGDKTFLSIIAGQTAVAIANAYAFDAARRGREQLAAILTSSADPILVVNDTNSIVLVNPAAERAFGVKAEKIVGKPVGEVIDAEPLVALLKGKDGNTESESSEPIEWQNAAGNTFAPSVSEICDDNGTRTGQVLILRDITRYKNLRDNQSEFVSTVSHDLRTPLTYMQGYATMLPMIGELNEKQKGSAEKILSGIAQMTDLVDKILDAGRLDPEGNYTLNREACDVHKVVHDIVNTHVQPAEKKGLKIVPEADPGLPILNLDDMMLRRALNNLVDNAVKYTPEHGTITVKAALENNHLLLIVQDTGLGISEENQKTLFERFRRVRRREHMGVKGSGLGLFIVKQVAQRHGGDAWVESKEGEGS